MKDINYYKHVKKYVLNDFVNPKESTKSFFNFLEKNLVLNCFENEIVLDMGAGAGSGTYYFSKNKKSTKFIGVDYNRDLVKWVNDEIWENDPNYKSENLELIYGDWNKPHEIINFISPSTIKSVLSIHSLCTQKNFGESMSKLINLDPEYIAINSLFYDGPLDILIHIRDLNNNISDDNPDADFNIHSLPAGNEFMKKFNYEIFDYESFNININLERPKDKGRGTYTIKTEFSDFTQFSGPVYLPWCFVLYKKNNK